jgi:hypothetical protein
VKPALVGADILLDPRRYFVRGRLPAGDFVIVDERHASQLGLHRMCRYPRTRLALVLPALCAEIFNNYVAIGRTLVWSE